MESVQVKDERRHRRPLGPLTKALGRVAAAARRARARVATEVVVVRLVRDVLEGDAERAVAEVRHVDRHLLVDALLAHRHHRHAVIPMKCGDVMRKQFVRPHLRQRVRRQRQWASGSGSGSGGGGRRTWGYAVPAEPTP